ncbi:MAG: hypothetical protein H7Z75_22585, partial [Ferruginibacter sp.]|nr:hypothetical protein [Cytophagales bacterium]
QVQNLPLVVHQWGTTWSVNYVAKRFQVKPFITFQNTTLLNYSKYSNTDNARAGAANGNDPQQNNINSGKGTEIDHQFTPRVYGGASVNYQISQKIDFNLNPYYYSKHTFYHADHLLSDDKIIRGVGNIRSKLILNAKLSYSPVKAATVFVSAKNLLNDRSQEYYNTDRMGSRVLAGVNFQY